MSWILSVKLLNQKPLTSNYNNDKINKSIQHSSVRTYQEWNIKYRYKKIHINYYKEFVGEITLSSVYKTLIIRDAGTKMLSMGPNNRNMNL